MIRVKSLARLAFHYAGGLGLVRLRNRGGLRILMHHRFPRHQVDQLARQCHHLKRYYQPVSLTQVAEWLGKGEDFPPNAIAITVDDGYRDFYLNAHPVFAAHKIPVTIYLVSDFLDRKSWLWTDRIKYAVDHTQAAEIELPEWTGLRNVMPLDTSEQRSRASYVVRESAKRLPNDRRVQLVSELPRLLDVNFPAEMPEEFAPLDWREVREMDGNFVDFGAHTVTHPTLSNIADERELWHEIEGCKARIEQELRRPVLHFCYPSGQLVDIRPEPVDIARRAGYLTAVTSENGFNSYAADPFLLRRIGVEPALPDVYFRELIAGLPQIFKAQPAVTPQFTKEES